MWEGGFRVCSLAWGPGFIPAGTESDEIMTSMDLYPTFANLAGGSLPEDTIIDGKDIQTLLRNDPGATTPHDVFFYRRAAILYAVRSGPWKLFVKDYRQGNNTLPAGTLFNLDNDIGETTDVSAAHPDVVARLQQLAATSAEDIGDGRENPGKNRRMAAYIDLEDAVTLTTKSQN